MRVVRQRMIKTFKSRFPSGSLVLLLTLVALASCNPTEITGSNTTSAITNKDGRLDNKAFVYLESPTVLAGPHYSPYNPNIGSFLDRTPAHITENTNLTGNCKFFGAMIPGCLVSLSNEDSIHTLPRNTDRTYIFPAGSKEFYQVNAQYHLQKGINTFFDKLQFAYSTVHNPYLFSPPWEYAPAAFPRSLPPYLASSGMFWFRGVKDYNPSSQHFQNTFLNSFAQCKIDGNASFSPAGPELCFGGYSRFPGFYFVQDPSVIYHELGHALVSIMMNMRNATGPMNAHKFRSNLGSFGYNEAGAINEGIADYFSYVINGRTHVGEWALGRTANQSRPLSEDDPLHIPGISTTSEGRLSYPQYLLYDPNYPDSPLEDVHYAGQITTHYLVALTDALKSQCSFENEEVAHDKSTSYVFLLLAETLSELGDLKARGIDNYALSAPITGNHFFTNLDENHSYIWAHINNPPTYRRFFQIFSKNIYKYISGALCPSFGKNASEKLLDDYGLLLFKNYNNNGKSTKNPDIFYNTANNSIPAQPLVKVNENNRRKSVLVSKQLINLAERSDDTPDAVSYYIIDNRKDIQSLLQELLFKGLPIPLSSHVASTEYNNGNIRISPGEIVGIIPNLHNASNSTMAGVQILANDWDHVHITDTHTGNFKPCVFDNVTTADQGGEVGESCVNNYPDVNYKRLVKDNNNQFPSNAAAPVCMVQLEEGAITRWVSQNEFRKKNGLSLLDKDCLGFTTSGSSDTDFTFNPHECLVRFLPGANVAMFSKIDPQKNYFESVVKNSESKEFNTGNLLLMEVNKWIPPGTKFRCRLRARFSNCSDCYTNPDSLIDDDFIDAEYNGHRPFKIINFEFDVND